ncbi:hypothetical protein [Streptomyces sp. NPDC056194]|uniref:hypothetical protein n=1 Tax=unclassified Streptomyces TaxID=2593676 RepID=UPI0035E2E35C
MRRFDDGPRPRRVLVQGRQGRGRHRVGETGRPPRRGLRLAGEVRAQDVDEHDDGELFGDEVEGNGPAGELPLDRGERPPHRLRVRRVGRDADGRGQPVEQQLLRAVS